MVTTRRSSLISFTVLVFGRLTSMPDCRIGAVIIKMIRSTSMTSTKGTILISEREVPVWRASCGMRFYPDLRLNFIRGVGCMSVGSRHFSLLQVILLDQRRDFHGEIIHARAHFANIMHEVVIGDHRGDGCKQ